MKFVTNSLIVLILLTSCGLSKTGTPTKTNPTITTSTIIPSKIMTSTPYSSQTRTPMYFPSPTSTIIPTVTRTPYPIPPEILSKDELQNKMNEWVSGKILLTDADRLLDEKTGKPIRLGILAAPLLHTVIFDFYNLGYTIIEDDNGTPYLLNIVGFEDSSGQRFTFAFHNGKLFSKDTLIVLKEFNGKRINSGDPIYYDRLLPIQYLQKSEDIVNYINGGTTNIGSPGYGNESDTYMESSKKTTEDLTNFLLCDNCLVKDIPNDLEKYINKIPDKFEPTIPYLWVYSVSY